MIPKAAPVGMGSIAPSPWHLSGGYRFRGFDDWTPGHPRYRDLPAIEDETEPDEPEVIVAELHAEMAMKSPGLAVLVAEHDRLRAAGLLEWQQPQRGCTGGRRDHNDRLKADRSARLRKYAALRSAGLSKKQARAEVGIGISAGTEYEAAIRPLMGGDCD